MNRTSLYVCRTLLVLVVVLASGCASLSPYSISEGELERHLQDVVSEFE